MSSFKFYRHYLRLSPCKFSSFYGATHFTIWIPSWRKGTNNKSGIALLHSLHCPLPPPHPLAPIYTCLIRAIWFCHGPQNKLYRGNENSDQFAYQTLRLIIVISIHNQDTCQHRRLNKSPQVNHMHLYVRLHLPWFKVSCLGEFPVSLTVRLQIPMVAEFFQS